VTNAVVVGGGPNGLAAALALAKEGVQVTVLEAADEIGGGARSSEAIVPGLLHDHCSAFHPMAVGSTFLNTLGLERHGLQWRWPEIDCAHPLDDGDGGVLRRSLDDTVAGLGSDGPGGGRSSEDPQRSSTCYPRTSWVRGHRYLRQARPRRG
jgi:phytoene dehydrogenase-like protein